MSGAANDGKRLFALSVAATAILVAVAVIGVSTFRGADASGEPDAGPLPVQLLTVEYLPAAQVETRYPGIVTARRKSALGFETGGRIAMISVDVGDAVSQGDALARLDTRAMEARLASSRAEAAAAEAQAELARVTLERQRVLVERGHISEQRLDETQADARAAEARATAAQAAADALEVQLALASLEAPFDGMVTARHADEGAIAASGAPVLEVVETSALEFRAGLPAGETAALEPGALYEIEAGDRVLPVRLRALTGVVGERSRTVEAVFDLDAGAEVRPGEVARLILPARLDEPGFWAPVSAMAEGRRGLWSVYVLVEGAGRDGVYTVEPRSVELVHAEGDRVYLRGAVDDGERILAAGLQRVAPGQRVTPAAAES